MVMKTVTAAEANRNFSKLLADVKSGMSLEITSHGVPVAQIIPINAEDEQLRRQRMDKAREALFERLRNQPALNLGKMTRDEIYDAEEP
jgi:prevent-host-death family protein